LVIHQPREREERSLNGSHLLIAAGRVPNTEALNLDAAGIQTDGSGHIKTNDRLETNIDGIYALGDVKGGPAFTHISYDDYRILRSNLLEGGSATVHDRPIPYTVFIDPQLGRVGLTEKQASQKGQAYRVAKMPMNYVSRALEIDQTRGLMKALVDPDDGRILGCAVLGVQGGEIMAILEVAMMGQLPYTALREGVFTHPTLAESLNTLFTMLEDGQ
jgi:pyruvate/2-oxoglutarate dehydrogenase complex dihydrolipoamide dehydrogenase (E3) component